MNSESKRIFKHTLPVLLLSCLFCFFSGDPVFFIAGVLLGYSTEMLNFIWLEKILTKSLSMPSDDAQKYVSRRYFIRYVLIGVIIALAVVLPVFNIIGTIIGLLIVKTTILINSIVNKNKK
jgi:hypothetical protein